MRTGGLFCLLLAASLFLLSCRRNHPPDMPSTPSGPRSLWPGATGEFSTSTYDPDYQDSVSFQFDWGGGDTSAWTPFSESASAEMHHAWLNQGVYGVRVRARDVRNAESGWSESLAVSVAFVGFAPNVSVDHGLSYGDPSIAIGPSSGGNQPIYVAMQRGRSIAFQTSTDAGASWLAENRFICDGETPNVAADANGGIFIVYLDAAHVYCVRSFDGGTTWSSPARIDDCDTTYGIGSADVAADSAGHLFCAWNDGRSGNLLLWSSVSTDRGATWSPNVRVAGGSSFDYFERGVCVQPGTNDYFISADVEYHGACVYRSRDMGQTFDPGVEMEPGSGYTYDARVVSDREHVICGYFRGYGNGVARTRTLYTTPDTWGPCTSVNGESDNSYCCALAVSASGRAHTAQVMSRSGSHNNIYYAYSTDHGATWSAREQVNDDITVDKSSPDIGADSAGYVYIVWEDGRVANPGVWFSTNNPAGLGGGFRGRDTKQIQPRGKGIGPRGIRGIRDSHPISGSFGHLGRFRPLNRNVPTGAIRGQYLTTYPV